MPDDPVTGPVGAGSAPGGTTSTATGPATIAADDDPIMGAAQAAGGLAPWKKGARWQVVMTQGVILGVAGLIIWLAPGFGASAALQLIAVLLLAMALLSTWRIMRGQVAPARLATVAFRAGVGVTVGLITVIGAFVVEDRNIGTVALAIILGIGLVLYGLVALLATFARREPGSGIPIVALIVSALTVIVGLMLVVNGRNGIDALQGTFTVLGILMLLAGLGFLGYGFMLRNSQMAPGAEE
ncbi:MAG: hypothetical protein ABWZ82_00770 [Candidatus Limnocylindrales bacterium]